MSAGGAGGRFWDFLAAGSIRVPRCDGCGRWTWPAQYRCGDCGSFDFSWTDVDPAGEVFAWTRTHHAFDRSLAGSVPYTIVVGMLPGSGNVRLIGLLDLEAGDVEIGTPVRAAVGAADGGARVLWKRP
jgi:uncharacterized OB-fold protein